ncbi:MAG: hypothetical protein ACRETC_01010 [Gammaproteobacteria bacterium]
MRYGNFRFILPLTTIVFLAACVTPPPLNDHITLVPLSSKADAEAGLTMDYFYGSQDSLIDQIVCHADRSCLYSGHAYALGGRNPQVDSLVIHTLNGQTLNWARTYQIDDVFNNNLGMIPTADGGALLYGNSFITDGLGLDLHPVYEKIDAQGTPQWGGALDKGKTKMFTSFTDGISLSDGGYALAGSSFIDGQWRGTVLRLDASGNQVWFTTLDNSHEISFLQYLIELPDKHILGVGYDKTRNDMTLFDLTADGRLTHSAVLHMPGDEVPVGLAKLNQGPLIIASATQPNGEHTALLVRLDWKESVESATLYHYVDGLDPANVLALADQKLCLYGSTASENHGQSVAFTTTSKGRPISAIKLKGGNVFIYGTLLSSKKILFTGGRKIGTKQKNSGLIVKWTPSVYNDQSVLEKISFAKATLTVRPSPDAEQALTSQSVIMHFGLSNMSSRLVSGGTTGAGKTD